MAKLSVSRHWCYFGFARALKILIDGSSVGSVKSRNSFELDLPKGSHTIQVSMDWCKTAEQEFNLGEIEEKHFLAKTNFWLLALILCFIRPSKVFCINEKID